MTVQTLLTERDSYPPQSPEWIICNRTAWKMQMHADNVPPCEWDDAPPPADFGPNYLKPLYGIAAE